MLRREGNDFFRPCSSAFISLLLWFCLVLFLLVVFRYQPIRVKILPWFPGVVAHGIALPLNYEVHLAPFASWLRIQDLLDFEFLFPFYQIGCHDPMTHCTISFSYMTHTVTRTY